MAALHLLHTSQILAIFALGKEKVAPSKNWPPLRSPRGARQLSRRDCRCPQNPGRGAIKGKMTCLSSQEIIKAPH